MSNASPFVVARSFYSWVCNVSLQEGKSIADLDVLPTGVEEVAKFSKKILENLKGTKHEERATYWANLLNEFTKEK